MSNRNDISKEYGPNQRFFDQNISFKQFEVIDMGYSRVAVNEGTLSFGSSSITINKCQFTSPAKPQNIMRGPLDENLFLEVEKDDFVCIVLSNKRRSTPTAELLAISESDLNGDLYGRGDYKIFRLAKIVERLEESVNGVSVTLLDIENLFMSDIASETENWPPFTPIIWQEEGGASEEETPPVQPTGTCEDSPENTSENFKAVFVPGSIYLPQSMTQPIIFQLNGESMDDYPVVDVADGDEYVVEYSISSDWRIRGSPIFKKITSDSELETIKEVIPREVDFDNDSSIDSTSFGQNGTYTVKILRFTKSGNSLVAEIFWRSDIIIYGWQRGAGGGGENHPWKVTPSSTEGTYDVAIDYVYTQGTPILPDTSSVTAANGDTIYLKITRDEDTREISEATLVFNTEDLISDRYDQFRALAQIGTDGSILQLQFEEIRIHELMIVENGAFKLAGFELSHRNTYPLP